LSIAGTTVKTKTQKKTLTPKYNEKFTFDVKPPKSTDLVVDVYDWDAIGKDDKIGEGMIALGKANQKEISGWYPLTLKKKPAGEVFVIFRSPDVPPTEEPVADRAVAPPPVQPPVEFAPPAAFPAFPPPQEEFIPMPMAAFPPPQPVAFPVHPSLQLFASLQSVVVVQEKESSLLGLECANTYKVYNGTNKKKEKLLVAKEISTNVTRAGVLVVDEKGKTLMSRKGQISIEFRPEGAKKTSLWTFRSFTQPDMVGNLNWQLELPPAVIPPDGVPHTPDIEGAASFNEDALTMKIVDYRTNQEKLTCKFKKGGKTYQFMTAQGVEGAVITRQNKSMFSDNDSFKVDFAEFLSPPDKAMLTLAAIALDFMFFEAVPVTIHGTLAEGKKSTSKADLMDSLGKISVGTPPLSRKS